MKSLIRNITILLLFITVSYGNHTIDINEKIKIAQKQDKDLMIFFHIPHCPYCLRMLSKNFKDKETLNEIKKNFIFIDIYTKDSAIIKFKDFSGTTKDFATHLSAVAYPATIFLNKDEKILYRSIGYRNINELLTEMKYISTKSFKTMNLEDFSQKLEFERDD